MQNFDYLKEVEPLHDLHLYCAAAEATQKHDPDACAINSRRALEWIVKAIYQIRHLEIPERANLYELMTGAPFVEFLNDERLMMAAHYVRKVGNLSAHDGGVKNGQSFFCLLNLYNFVGGSLLKLGVLRSLAPFNRDLIPDETPMHVAPAVVVPPAPVEFVDSIPEQRVEEPVAVEVPIDDYTEAETRRLFIDLMLREAGWDVLSQKNAVVPGKACIEVKVEGMDNNSGDGYVDYVLYGHDGKALAIVEAKRTTVSLEVGKEQAKAYADCLERRQGFRPVIYVSNGFRTQIIDGLDYPIRDVLGFHSLNDLQWLIQQRTRGSITDLRIDDNITNRDYQKMAIHAVCDHFNTNKRRALLVMATGTGKTRVAISMCDVLMRNGWVKNVLFLADRTALVNQAHKSFKSLLPNPSMTVLNEDSRPDPNARITFSTYQTMIRHIDSEQKDYTIGRFDLVIIDEAHRSVFGKYRAILDYFDCLAVGLTATPREDVDLNTYELFGLEDGIPNFSYSLEEAVSEHYLVPPVWISRTTKRMKEGIRYDDLTEREREQMEAVWDYERRKGALEDDYRDIDSRELFKYIFNKDTINKVLTNLMETGYRIDGNEKLGKTIIFAASHDHAVFVVDCFKELYSDLGDDFCVLIDNQVKYAQRIIDRFASPESLPQIAVSVDMLDTGIDVPEVLNLVFFKRVRSKIKFWQMVGRGTRLCKNLLGDGIDKKDFQLIDWCGNIEYFGQESGESQSPSLSLSARLFNLRLELACALQHADYQQNELLKHIHDSLKKTLLEQVCSLKDSQLGVRQHWALVDKFRKAANWAYVSEIDAADLTNCVAPLLPMATTDTAALRFDVLILNQQLALVDETKQPPVNSREKVNMIAMALLERASIPQVAAKLPLISEIAKYEVLESATPDMLERVRTEIRDLVKYIMSDESRTFRLNIEDIVEDNGEVAAPSLVVTYKQRIVDWLHQNRDLPVIEKLRNLEQLSRADIVELERICWRELGTKEEYEAYITSKNMICGDEVAAFIRSIVGIDLDKATERYSQFLSETNLNPDQEEYLKTIIRYVCENGDITPDIIINRQPFVDVEWVQVFGTDARNVGLFVNNLHNVIVA